MANWVALVSSSWRSSQILIIVCNFHAKYNVMRKQENEIPHIYPYYSMPLCVLYVMLSIHGIHGSKVSLTIYLA